VRKFFAEAVMVDASLNDDPMMGILQVHEHADELGDGIGVEAGLDNGGGMPRP
jgi:hypothetical protein